MAHFAAILFLLLNFVRILRSANIPNVTTKLGTITGETKSVIFQENGFEVDRYLGIPYAKSPTGELRFKRPEPYGQFSEPFMATEFGASCPQHDYLHLLPQEKTAEDCLFLNIYVPRQEPDMKLGHAVMFFIHGGGFTIGSGKVYEGGVLSLVGNVIVVTINYRLGLLGFLDIDCEKSKGNFGLFDQRLALQWVRDNIGAFGGDNKRVTIFGESAGSMSVSLHMIYPSNKGLFRGGITQSGALTPNAVFYQKNNIEGAKYFAESMNCSIETMDEVFSCLQSASTENIMKVISDTVSSSDTANALKVGAAPTIDEEFIKTRPDELFKKAQTEDCEEINFFRSLKLINGINGKEGALYLLLLVDKDNFENFEQMNTQHIPGAVAVKYGNKQVPDVVKQLLVAEYTDWTNPDDPLKLRDELVRLLGDIYFNVAGVEMSRVHSNASAVDSYLYNFVARLDKYLMPTPNWLKEANHADELGPVFGYNLDYEAFFNISNYKPPAWELQLSRRMMTYWTNFAKSGDPNEPASDAVADMFWPKYNVKSQSYIRFDREDSTSQYLFARETDFSDWMSTVPAVMDAVEHAQTAQCGSKDERSCDEDDTCG